MSSSKSGVRPSKRTRSAFWRWTEEGTSLLEADRRKAWRQQATGFSAYVELRAQELGVDKSALWRAIAAVKFYHSMNGSFEGWRLPRLSKLEEKTSPEVLEMIERHSRVLPRQETLTLLKRAAAGELTRRELLHSWRAYQSALKRIPSLEDAAQEIMAAAVQLGHLARAPVTWTGKANPFASRILVNTRLHIKKFADGGANIPENLVAIDLIAVVQEELTSSAVLHGVEFVSERLDPLEPTIGRALRLSMYFDYFWIASGIESAKTLLSKLDDNRFGVLAVNGDIQVLRPAKTNPSAMSGRLAAQLLATARLD